MKKVLFVATVVRKHIMVFHIPYLKWFKENGYETYVCARNDYRNESECKIPYCDHYIDLSFERSPISLKNIGVYKELKKIIDLNNFEIIHCHTPMGGVLTRLAAKKARNKGSKVLYTAHGFHFYKGAPLLNWIIYYSIERWLANVTDTLITINSEDYRRSQSFKAGRVAKIPGVGINVEHYSNVSVTKENKRRELNIPEDSFVVLSVGELNHNKNHKTIIEAISKLDNPNIVYLICGDGPLKEFLLKLSQKLGVENNVKLLGFRKDINEICKAADIFAFPSKREGLGLAAIEAMAAGLPIITSNVHGILDYSMNGITGYTNSPEDSEGFAKSIASLCNDNNAREKMGRHNQELAKNFDEIIATKMMRDIYGKMA